MAALTKSRNTPQMGQQGKMFTYPVAGSATIYMGSMVCLNAAGNAIPGAANTTSGTALLCTGDIVNPGTVAGAVTVNCCEAIARFANGNSIDKTSIGASCYYTDDQTVTSSSSGSSVAGIIVDVDSLGVWVKLSQPSVVAY